MSKHRESLEECLKYKDFLDGLTPQEYFEEQKELLFEDVEWWISQLLRVFWRASSHSAPRQAVAAATPALNLFVNVP